MNKTMPKNTEWLVGYWPMNEGSGTTIADQSGNNRNLTIANAAQWVSGTSTKLPVLNPTNGSGDDTGGTEDGSGNINIIGTAYRYGFNGQEKSDEIKGAGNSYTAEFWEYDPRAGRRWNLDPKPIVSISQYSAFNNNPILLTDLLGDSSVFDYKGNKLFYDKNDKDLRVFMKGKNNKLELIGNLGGNIQVTTILNERLKLTRTQMSGLSSGGGSFLNWIGSVWQGSRYDFKNNENTIWGVAWAYDKSSHAAHTSFSASYNGLDLEFSHAADVGNFHAGYAGGYAGVSISTQKFWAGAGEKGKNAYYGYIGGHVQEERDNLWGNTILGAPWGDRKPDYFWNTLGMSMADYDKKTNAPMETKPYTLPQLDKVSSDNLRLVPRSIILPKSK